MEEQQEMQLEQMPIPEEVGILMQEEDQEKQTRTLIEQGVSSTPVEQHKIQDPVLMGYSLSAAVDGQIDVVSAVRSMSTDASSAALRDVGAALYVRNIRDSREQFDRAAAAGIVDYAEQAARNLDASIRNRLEDDFAKTTIALTREAATNVATTNPDVIKNTRLEKLAAIVDQKGTMAGVQEVVAQGLYNKFGEDIPGIGSAATFLAGLFGTGAVVSKVAGKGAGTVVMAGLGTATTVASNKGISDAIEKVVGISNPEKMFGMPYAVVDQSIAFRAHLQSLPAKEQMETVEKVVKHIMDNSDYPYVPETVDKLVALFNVTKLLDSVDKSTWKDGDWLPSLSLQLQRFIDVAGLGVDAASVLGVIRYASRPAKVQADLSGAHVVGERVGKDMVEGKDTLDVSKNDRIHLAQSADGLQNTPDAIVGAGPSIQKEMAKAVEALLPHINGRLGVLDSEAIKVRNFIYNNTQLPHSGFSMAKYDMTSGEMLIQHPSGRPYADRNLAENVRQQLLAEGLDPTKVEVVPANGVSLARLGEGEFVEGWHWSNKKLGAIKPSTEGAYGPGAYLYLDELPAARGAAMEGGWSHLIKTGFKVDDTIDVSVPLAEQSAKVQNVAKKLNITDVKDFTKVDQDVLRNEGLIGIGNSKDDLVGRAQVNVFAPEKLPVELRKQYFMAEDDVIQAAIDAAAKGDRAPLKALEAKVEVLRKTLEQSGTARAHFNGGLNMLQSTLPDVGKVVPGAIKPMLSAVAKKSSDAGYATIAQRLSSLFDQIGLSSIRVGLTNEDVLGSWTVKGGKEYIKFSSKALGNETTLLHETAHAATANILDKVARNSYDDLALSDKQLAAAKSILSLASNKELATTLRAATKGTTEAGYVEEMLRSPHEFLAYGLSERGIIHNTLNKFVMDGKPAIHKLFQWMADVLGLRTDSALAKLHSDFFDLTDELVDVQRTSGIDDIALLAKEMGVSTGWYVRHKGIKAVHSAEEIESRFALGGDPLHMASHIAVQEKFIVDQAVQADKKIVSEMLAKQWKPLSNKERKRVANVLMEGDALEREFSSIELAARNLSEKEQRAYFAMREVSDLFLALKNKQDKLENIRLNFTQQAYIKVGEGHVTSPARVVDPARLEGKKAYNLLTGKVEKISAENMSGLIAVETRAELEVGGGSWTTFIGDSSAISFGALEGGIPKRAGTFRRIYSDDFFGFVSRNKTVNDEMVEKKYTMRTAISYADIDKWKQGMNAVLDAWRKDPASITHDFIRSKVGKWEDVEKTYSDIMAGKWDDYISFDHHPNRGGEDYLQNFSRSLYDSVERGSRGKEKLIPIDDAARPNTLDPFQAMQAELTNVARLNNITDWRNKYVDMWMNSFGDLLPDEIRYSNKSPIEKLSSPIVQQSAYTGSDPRKRLAESQRRYILSQLGVETLDEAIISAAMQSLTASWSRDTKLLGVPIGEPLIKAGHVLRNADPLQFIRSFNFYSMLALLNPSQLLVQGAGAGTAVAISPIHGMKALYMAVPLRIAMMSDNPAVWKTIAQLSGQNAEDMSKLVVALRKTGLLDGVAATSMHNVEAGAFNMYGHMSRTAADWAAQPFNKGEEFAKLVSFDVARREWQAANKGGDWTSDAALQTIMMRTDDFTQNMTQANKARYQRGILSIPSQFLQYNLKLSANLASAAIKGKTTRGFTRVEAARVLGFHLTAYGLAGNGLLMLADEIGGGFEAIFGRKMTEDEQNTVVQGWVSGLINEISQLVFDQDAKFAIGSRLGVGDFYYRLYKGLSSLDSTTLGVLLGPTAGSIERTYGALGKLLLPLVAKDLSAEAALGALNDVGKGLVTGWRNATKAYVASNNANRITNEFGVPVVGPLSTVEIWGQGLGVMSSKEVAYWNDRLSISESKKAINELADSWKQAHLHYLDALNKGDKERANKWIDFMNTLTRGMPTRDKEMFENRIKMHDDKVWPYTSKAEELGANYLQSQFGVRHSAKDLTSR